MRNLKTEVRDTIVIHVARTWERIRKEKDNNDLDMPYDNIGSVDVIQTIAEIIMSYAMIREFIKTKDGMIWNREGDGCSDIYIERKAIEIINNIA
jgi:hypothetical protein